MSVKTHQPLLWVPSSFFSMGLVNQILVVVSAIMFKNLGMGYGEAAAYASQFYLAYAIQPLLAPLVDTFKTKKFFVITMQVLISAGFGLVALCLQQPVYVAIVVWGLWLISFAGAVQDVASNGVYLGVLDSASQAKFIGLQSMGWGLGPVVAMGVVVAMSGHLYTILEDWASVWQIIFFVLSLVMILFAFVHYRLLPDNEVPAARVVKDPALHLVNAFSSFFQKKGVWAMIAFAFLYRVNQGLLEKIIPFFMIDASSEGGLGLDNIALGYINTLGFSALLLGVFIGGWFIASRGLKPSLFLLCCCANSPSLFYLLLSYYQPMDIWWVVTVIPIEKFLFGVGATAHMVYMMQQLAPGKYTATHYAFGTGLMVFCMWSMGSVSGYLVDALGYEKFFVVITIAAIPSLIATWFAPFYHDKK